jgi:N-acyl-phosphatidylethanolamine-hydrolysing phospholipase D
VLTDPVWSTRVGPPFLQMIGPKRFQSPPASIDSIIEYVDVVLISHSHYDHLDLEAVKAIGNAKFWIVPMGLKAILANIGIENCIELNWWDSYTIDVRGRSVEIVLTPAKHWSARGLFDRNATLWGSYVMISGSEKFFFGGDTAYCPVFKQIGEKYGPFDISCIPIGAYKPRWFMKDVHCDPSEALKIHQDIKSKKSLGIHWGTFPLAEDDAIEPALELARARETVAMSAVDFFTTRHGDTYSVADSSNSVLKGDYALGQQPVLFDLFKAMTMANKNGNITPG